MKKKKLDIVYEDKDILVVNKKSGLLSISTDNEKERTLFHEVLNYVKMKHKKNKIFIVHRLDKDTSGVMVFAKSLEIKKILQDNWEKLALEREYVGIIEGDPPKEKDRLINYLSETKTYLVYISDKKNGKLAITNYRKITSSNDYSLLAFNLETGRKNQIRIQMKGIAHPIVGDKKYGSTKNPLRRMALHANKLVLIHPRTKEKIILETAIPNSFIKLLKL